MVGSIPPPDRNQAGSMRPVMMGRTLKSILTERLGQILDIQVLKSSLDGKRALLSIAGQRFEAHISGKALTAGQTLKVLVNSTAAGFEFIRLDLSALQLPDLAAPLKFIPDAPAALQRMFSIFALLFDNRLKLLQNTDLSAQDRREQFQKLRSMALRLKSNASHSSPIGSLLEVILSDTEATELLPESSWESQWQIAHKNTDQTAETLQLQSLLRHSNTPAYYFFQLKSSLGWQLAGTIVSPKSDFNPLALQLLVQPSGWLAQLKPLLSDLKGRLQQSGIQILDLQIGAPQREHSLDLRA